VWVQSKVIWTIRNLPAWALQLTKSEGPRDVKWMVYQPFHTSHELQRVSQFGVTVKGSFIDPA
jgi:hypothetical protein